MSFLLSQILQLLPIEITNVPRTFLKHLNKITEASSDITDIICQQELKKRGTAILREFPLNKKCRKVPRVLMSEFLPKKLAFFI